MAELEPWSRNREDYKRWGLNHPLMLHLRFNPGIAFNELILGQSVPAEILVGKDTSVPLFERQAVECPQCGTIFDGRVLGGSVSFLTWYGLYCPLCEHQLPRVRNLLTGLITVITWPFWRPLRPLLRPLLMRRHLRLVRQRMVGGSAAARPPSAWKMGLGYAVSLLLAMALFALWQGQMHWTWLMVNVPVWGFVGAFFGLAMKFFFMRQTASGA